MTKILLPFLLVFTLFSISSAREKPQTPPDISRSIEAIQMTWDDPNGHYDVSGCTAGYIGNDLWVTAGHCFAPDSPDQKNMRFLIEKHEVEILFLDPDTDIAVLKAPAPSEDIPLRLRLYGAELGETVYSEGFPFGGYTAFYVSGEVMNQDYAVGEKQYTVTSMMVSPGMSGSPVVDREGAFLGVLQAGWGTTVWKSMSGFTPFKYLNAVEKFFNINPDGLHMER